MSKTYQEHREDLLAAGFRESKNTSDIWTYDTLFQKKIDDDYGTRYFVEAMVYGFPTHDVWEVEVNFNDGTVFSLGCAMKIQIYSLATFDWNAADLLRWADELWQRLAPIYYEKKS